LVGTNPERIKRAAFKVLNQDSFLKDKRIPPLWDGNAAERICAALLENSKRHSCPLLKKLRRLIIIIISRLNLRPPNYFGFSSVFSIG
jgi:hypothetical protein